MQISYIINLHYNVYRVSRIKLQFLRRKERHDMLDDVAYTLTASIQARLGAAFIWNILL